MVKLQNRNQGAHWQPRLCMQNTHTHTHFYSRSHTNLLKLQRSLTAYLNNIVATSTIRFLLKTIKSLKAGSVFWNCEGARICWCCGYVCVCVCRRVHWLVKLLRAGWHKRAIPFEWQEKRVNSSFRERPVVCACVFLCVTRNKKVRYGNTAHTYIHIHTCDHALHRPAGVSLR